ncbi:hypothetical protein FB446DRAFT_795648 [Lentinula raphanica]|nr:hypothetical protein FB446DRAFT_795648 [Lentinula raphanica]
MVLELGTHIYPTGAAARITVDYDDVREFQYVIPHSSLSELSKIYSHTTYSFKPNYSPAQIHIPYVPQPEQEDIIRYHTPIPDPSIGIDEFWGIQNSSDDEMKPQDAHWILHPSFNNHCLHVTIDHPQYGTTGKWIDIRNGILSFQKQVHQNFEILDKEHIQKPKISPRHTSKSILAIIDGEHHGQFVRCIGKGKREGDLLVAFSENAGESSEVLNPTVFSVASTQVVEVRTKNNRLGSRLIVDLCKKIKEK